MFSTSFLWGLISAIAQAHDPLQGQFDSLDPLWPTPNDIRQADGRPGPKYWQQQADYTIHVTLNEETQSITASQNIHYTNHAPTTLPYLWLQLDMNQLSNQSERELMRSAPHLAKENSEETAKINIDEMKSIDHRRLYEPNLQIHNVQVNGQNASYLIDNTQMRINLPTPLGTESSADISMEWSYNLNDASVLWARSGYEYFEEEDNYIFNIAQFYPRMTIYTDQHGWLTKEFLGTGEFATEFGNYDVYITVPKDHIVGATGLLQNPEEVLTSSQQKRLEHSQKSDEPIFIVKPIEALENQKLKNRKQQTWHFHAENVRDFAWGSSRKFIWDAWGVDIQGQTVMAMSFYPPEAKELWQPFSTHAVAHTLNVYSRVVLPYPYPVAISMNGPIYGMEYPMLSFNGPRPVEDGTYFGDEGPWVHQKYGLISVIIHEVGHNWFPMIINSDERSWAWMDEGLNTYVQHIAELEWEKKYPSKKGEPYQITTYMQDSHSVPIMTDADSIRQLGRNSYAKPAAALTLLRNTIIGVDNFDFAFQQYAQNWAFKRPYPADFFRSIEDATGKDLDWFWRAWFYSTNHVDLGITNITVSQKSTHDPAIDKKKKQLLQEYPLTLSEERSQNGIMYVDQHPSTKDFYSTYDPTTPTAKEEKAFLEWKKDHNDEEKTLMTSTEFYNTITIENLSQMPTPIIMEIHFENGEKDRLQIPAHVWRKNNQNFNKLVISQSPITKVILDPLRQTGDCNLKNNTFPQQIQESIFDVIDKTDPPQNPMQEHKANEDF